VGAQIQLAGGWTVVRARDVFQLRAPSSLVTGMPDEATSPRARGEADGTTNDAVLLSNEGTTQWRAREGGPVGQWLFRCATTGIGSNAWSAWLPDDQPLSVRAWRPGDVMSWRMGSTPRKVKRFLSDAGITGHERAGWPVVLAGDQIVWIPGVRRGYAAPARSGRPGLAFVCEFLDC
jgi:tRNA(Ile)-lysidine synthase